MPTNITLRTKVERSAHKQEAGGNGCEGPQPSKPQPIIVATNGMAIVSRFPGGHPLRRPREKSKIDCR